MRRSLVNWRTTVAELLLEASAQLFGVAKLSQPDLPP